MQFQVPQFIETEDKVVGPLTLKQFAYIGCGVILSAIFYFALQTWLWAMISFFIAALVIALAFVHIEGRPFVDVVRSAFNFYWKPQTYVWQSPRPVAQEQPKVVENSEAGLASILAHAAHHQTVRHPVVRPQPVKPQPVVQPQSVKPEPKSEPKAEPEPLSREKVSAGESLHKSWEGLQTGMMFARKNSDKQFLEKKMEERYQIFKRISGERGAAKRIDYR